MTPIEQFLRGERGLGELTDAASAAGLTGSASRKIPMAPICQYFSRLKILSPLLIRICAMV